MYIEIAENEDRAKGDRTKEEDKKGVDVGQ